MKISELITIGIVFAVATFAGVFFAFQSKPATFGGTSSLNSYPCSTVTTTNVVIGNQVSTTLLSASSRRAWARISVPANATSTFYVSLGGTASVGNGVALNYGSAATSTPSYVDVGLATWVPFTGAITGITSTGSTTALVSTCAY